MTIAKAERITGYNLTVLRAPTNHLTITVSDKDGKLITEFTRKRKTCTPASKQINQMAQEFVDWNYRLVSDQVRQEQNYRCIACGQMKPLQTHHKVLRSQGRDDRRKNLEARCQDCHESQHN